MHSALEVGFPPTLIPSQRNTTCLIFNFAMSDKAEHIAPATAEPWDPCCRFCRRENKSRVAHSNVQAEYLFVLSKERGTDSRNGSLGSWSLRSQWVQTAQVTVLDGKEDELQKKGSGTGEESGERGQVLTIVPEGRAVRWQQSFACCAFAVAACGLGTLHPVMAALLRAAGRPSSHPRAFTWGSQTCGCPSRGVRHLLPQGLLGRHDLPSLGEEGTLVAQAELPAAVASMALHWHHKAVVTAAGTLGCPQRHFRCHRCGLLSLHSSPVLATHGGTAG